MSQLFQLRIRQMRQAHFSSAVVSSLVSLSGGVLLVKLVWAQPSGHIWGAAGFTLLLVLVLFQLGRIHRLYETISPQDLEREPLLQKSLNETVRTFRFGSAVFLLLALAVFQFHLLK
jgi:hypothetical protein